MEKKKEIKANIDHEVAKKKVEELKNLKQQKEIEKKEKLPNPNKIDEVEVLQRLKKETGKENSIKETIKVFLGNIKIRLKNLKTTFTHFDTSIQICIIVPVAIILVIIGNSIYSKSVKSVLTCKYETISTSLKLNQELKIVFKKDRIYKQTSTLTYEIVNPKKKTLGQLETEKIESNKKLNETKGITAKYKIVDDKLVNTIEYNFYKLSSEDITALQLDDKSSLEEYKKRLEDFDYECKSTK